MILRQGSARWVIPEKASTPSREGVGGRHLRCFSPLKDWALSRILIKRATPWFTSSGAEGGGTLTATRGTAEIGSDEEGAGTVGVEGGADVA